METRDARGKTFRFVYDRLGRITRKVNASPVTVTVTQPGNGTVTTNPDGTSTYRPDPEYSGPDSYDYTVNGRNGDASTGTVSVIVNPVDDLPVAVSDLATVAEDGAVTSAVLANDTGIAEAPLSVTIAAGPANGSVTVNPDLTITYAPAPNFFGADTYAYTVADFDGDMSTASVGVTVTSVNDPPLAAGAYTPAVIGVPMDIALRGSDVDHCELAFTLVSAPALGTFSGPLALPCAPGSPSSDRATISYTASATGFDSFTFRVQDAEGASSDGVVSIVVTASGAALLGVHTEARTAFGVDDAETLDDGSCTSSPCALTSLSDSSGPASASTAFARASRGSLAASASGSGDSGPGGVDASFASLGSAFFTLPDLTFVGPDATVCPAGMNLHLNGLLSAMAGAGATATSEVTVRADVGGNVFDGTLRFDGVFFTGTGLLAGVTDTSDVLLTTPGFCVPTGQPIPLTVSLAASVDATIAGVGAGASAVSDFSSTLSFPESGPVFQLPPGVTVDAPSGGIADNRWVDPVIGMVIDVQPRDPENRVRCRPDRRITVAVITTADFDALSLDADTVELAGAHEFHRRNGRAKRHEKDVDHDGDQDLLFHFRLGDSSLTCNENVVSLTGRVARGTPAVVGSDRIRFRASEDDADDDDHDDDGHDDGDHEHDEHDDDDDDDVDHDDGGDQ